MVAQRRSGRACSYTLAAVLVVLLAPTLVVLSFMGSLPDSHIGEFTTHLARRGGRASGGRARVAKRLPAELLAEGLQGAGAADAGLVRSQTEGGTLGSTVRRKAAELKGAIQRNDSQRGGSRHDAGGSAAAGSRGTLDSAASGGRAAAGGTAVRGSVGGDERQAGGHGRQAAGQGGQGEHQHRQQQRGEVKQQQADEPRKQQALVDGEQAAAGLAGQRDSERQGQSAHAGRGQASQQQASQRQQGRGAGDRAARGSGLPEPLGGRWPNLLPQGKGPLLARPGCADKQPAQQCKSWTADDGCERNPGFMYHNCATSCGLCTVRYLHGAEVPQQSQVATDVAMPMVGYGTAGLTDLTADAVFTAIRLGYRLVDSAEAREWYREDLVGWGWSASGIKREHLFITSKVHPRHLGYWSTLDAVAAVLQDLQTDYVDLVLLHYPECWGGMCGDGKVEGTWQDSWAALEQLVGEKKVRAVGVSNFNLDQMAELVRLARVKPALLQANSDLLHQEWELQAFCRRHGIQFQGYSSLGGQWLAQTQGENPVLDHPTVQQIAQRLGRSPAQVALRWALQHGQAVVPRTSKVNRMESNLDLFSFDLTDADMQSLDGLDGSMQLAFA